MSLCIQYALPAHLNPHQRAFEEYQFRRRLLAGLIPEANVQEMKLQAARNLDASAIAKLQTPQAVSA